MRARSARHGYTLVELLVVLAMLGVMCGMAMPMAEMTVQREKERELKRGLWELRDAIDSYRRARESGAITAAPGTSLYPPTLDALTRAWPDARPDRQGQVLRLQVEKRNLHACSDDGRRGDGAGPRLGIAEPDVRRIPGF